MTLRILALAAALLAVGCVAPAPTNDPEPQSASVGPGGLAFATTMIDTVRAGGEPVIQITPKGTILVSTHPGWTHTRYPPSTNLLTPASGQSYLWRSTDQGATWTHIGLPMADGIGPRGLGQGVSDPDFAIDSKGRVYFTDLEALAAASVSWSDDDGQTWLVGNDIASTYGPIDRQWLATHGTDVYFMGNYFVDERVLKSTDGGLTWMQVGSANCGGDFVARNETQGGFALLVGCGDGIDVSTDGGKTFTKKDVPDTEGRGISMAEPAIDAVGNVFTTWRNDTGVYLAGTSDLGESWTTPLQLQPPVEGTAGSNIFPWVVAGDAGRVAVVWYHSDAENASQTPDAEWFVVAAYVLDAMGATPQVSYARVVDEPIHKGYVCVGTVCQANTEMSGDRRLGDFFEAAIDAEGYLNVAYAVTTGGDAISHPGFARQTAGPRLTNAS